VFDIAARSETKLPGSLGLWAPKWSPDGCYIAAKSAGAKQILIWERATGKWSVVARPVGTVDYVWWSRDGEHLYFNVDSDQAIYRVRRSGGAVEEVLRMRDFRMSSTIGRWFGPMPDDSIVVLRDTGLSEVYSLDVDLP
jgi:eukaryotic-like serine/threonine-protein kinase